MVVCWIMFVCLTQWVTCVCVMETNILIDGTILLLACIVGVIREGSDPLLGGGGGGLTENLLLPYMAVCGTIYFFCCMFITQRVHGIF